ncbi:hypothetical protein SNEBB_010212 [Seison nebaliae]|nr:hypothetical protein SNEBB_010212 [Seison nebaliae]
MIGNKKFLKISQTFVIGKRWRKRLGIDPPAKSKVWYVRTPTKIDEVQHKLMKKWTNEYRAEMRSLRQLLLKCENKYEAEQEERKRLTESADEFERLMKMNDEMNEKVKKKRLINQKELEMEEMNHFQQLQESYEKLNENQRLSGDHIYYLEKRRMDHFVNMDNLDEEISKALDSISDFDFAIDQTGNIYAKTANVSPDILSQDKSNSIIVRSLLEKK